MQDPSPAGMTRVDCLRMKVFVPKVTEKVMMELQGTVHNWERLSETPAFAPGIFVSGAWDCVSVIPSTYTERRHTDQSGFGLWPIDEGQEWIESGGLILGGFHHCPTCAGHTPSIHRNNPIRACVLRRRQDILVLDTT
jgi:hypothetical protein